MEAKDTQQPVKVVGSVFIPDGWVAFRDFNKRTICVVIVDPVYRILAGDPYDKRIYYTVVNKDALARFAQQQMFKEHLANWEPTTRAN